MGAVLITRQANTNARNGELVTRCVWGEVRTRTDQLYPSQRRVRRGRVVDGNTLEAVGLRRVVTVDVEDGRRGGQRLGRGGRI